jgi:hypothetical protein
VEEGGSGRERGGAYGLGSDMFGEVVGLVVRFGGAILCRGESRAVWSG